MSRTFDAAAVRARFGAAPAQIPDWLGLVGDAVDNLPGVPGVGPRTVAALLAAFARIEAIPAVQRPGERAAFATPSVWRSSSTDTASARCECASWRRSGATCPGSRASCRGGGLTPHASRRSASGSAGEASASARCDSAPARIDCPIGAESS